MPIIRKKSWPKDFELINNGRKKFEIRLADFEVEAGDTFVLEEWNPDNKEYTGRSIERKVDYVYPFRLDQYGQKKEIEEKGVNVIQFE